MKRILTTVALCLAAALAGAEKLEIKTDNYRVQFDKNAIFIANAKTQRMIRLGQVNFTWSPPVASPVNAESVSENEFRVEYKIDKDATGEVAMSCVVSCLPEGIKMAYRLTAPAGVKTGGTMQVINPMAQLTRADDLYKSGLWTRDANGGIPYEVRDGYYRAFTGRGNTLWAQITGNHSYTSSWAQHIAFNKAGDSGEYTAEAYYFITPDTVKGFEAAAIRAGRPAALEITTGKDFNLWESGIPEFKLQISNTGGKALAEAALKVVAYDFDGKKVIDQSEKIALEPGLSKFMDFVLPADERNIYFVEAVLEVDGQEIFTRTNLAKMPPYEYRHRENSNIGMAAFFAIPSEKAVFELMRRMGVRHLRNGDNTKTLPEYGMVSFVHNNVSRGDKSSPAEMKNKLRTMIDSFEARQNPGWEFCNEWNMKPKGQERIDSAVKYVELLKIIDEIRKERKYNIEIISMGIAGSDPGYLKLWAENGGWPLMDAIAFHPGRGNSTPDYTGPGWTYLGTIQRMKKEIEKHGAKPYYLTEVYAANRPNDWWKDSYRQAAENVILTFAIGLAEGAASVQFYQMHDAVWHDKGGVNHKDGEYHYGLLFRNGEIKPAVLAYAAIAEALDGAKFAKRLTFGDSKMHGLGFDTPRGKLSIIYDRTDGFLQSKKSDTWTFKEPWVDHWKTQRELEFASSQNEVTVVDAIGRASKVPVSGGKVKLKVSGAPQMVYGLDF